MFATTNGTPVDAQNIVNRHFKPLLRRAGLPDIRWHDLRHTCATLLLSRGTHPTYVQKLLGHASVQLTLDRYSHWMPSMGKHTANEWTRFWDRVYCCPTAAKAPDVNVGGFSFFQDLQVKKRADERTRTADLLITSDHSGVAGGCRGLQIPHI